MFVLRSKKRSIGVLLTLFIEFVCICPSVLTPIFNILQFCNGIQLNRILPPGPREYWNELAAEHKNVEEHQKWMYESDPFAARKAVTERQEKASKKRDESQQGQNAGGGSTSKVSKEFLNAPEVKMATELRELVEDAIKKV